MRQALAHCEPLLNLQRRLAEADARMQAIRPLLPPGMLVSVSSGPTETDGSGWTLLAANPGVAAKLRQLLPRFEAALQDRGLQASPIHIRVQSPKRA
ncbi:hypothetical protein [Leptothrix discophora]|uniref:DUF721 domain-containing protein n=1 Tax=Leptothrix discophora TaxID=89 RepID=A0ABT9G345_LEPDI|nr:hypothetical protein [Leptothrix discophora]MDP4300909.1 hypothetical protein [Leptothrix discophora]